MKRTLREASIRPNYEGLHVNYVSVDGLTPTLEIPVLVRLAKEEKVNIETRNIAKTMAIEVVKSLMGNDTEVEILL
jgi:hypothetical protein